ncbi:hypothetical protein SLS57_009919 [Botryosphaeria dothidea]
MVQIIAILFYVASLALAQSPRSTYTSEKCITSYGRGSSTSSISTIWNTTTVSGQAFARGTTTPVSTLNPPPVTSTSTSVITRTSFVTFSGSQGTETATTTRTFTVSSIVSSVSTFTTVLSLNSTTTITGTTTIPTRAGFTPVAAGVVAQGGVPSKRKRWQPKYPRFDWLNDLRMLAPGNGSHANRCRFHVSDDGGVDLFPPQAPTAVFCNREVRIESTRIFWKTASVTTTITAEPSTRTAMTTTTTTRTSSVGSTSVDATRTITASTTTTIRTTTTFVCQSTVNCTTSAYYVDGGNCLLGNATGVEVNQFYTTSSDTDDIFAVSNGAGDPNGDFDWAGLVDGFGKRKH